jgi:hypothetical protein
MSLSQNKGHQVRKIPYGQRIRTHGDRVRWQAMRDSKWVQLLAYVTGSVNQEPLLQNEYLAAENRILRTKLPARCD